MNTKKCIISIINLFSFSSFFYIKKKMSKQKKETSKLYYLYFPLKIKFQLFFFSFLHFLLYNDTQTYYNTNCKVGPHRTYKKEKEKKEKEKKRGCVIRNINWF